MLLDECQTMTEPLNKLERWWEKAKFNSPLKQKNAVCLSTIDELGFPNSRYVDLKSIESNRVIFCSSYDSPKAKNISNNPKVGLTIWWDHVGYQIRIIGKAYKVDEGLSEKLWKSRKRGAQVAAHSFNQSEEVESKHLLINKVKGIESLFENREIPKPNTWGAYMVEPSSIEFLQFKENRMHFREFYVLEKEGWSKTFLQP